MPFIPVENVALAEIRCLIDQQHVENTLYFLLSAGWDEGTLTELGVALIEWWTDHIKPLVSSNLVLKEVVCTDLTSDTAPSMTSTPVLATTGDDSAEMLPLNCSLSVSFRTAGRGRSSRGRNYVVGLTGDAVDSNEANATFVDGITAAYQALSFGGSFDLDATWVVVSRFHDNAPRTAGVATPVSAVVVVDNVIDSQRRRLPGRGR